MVLFINFSEFVRTFKRVEEHGHQQRLSQRFQVFEHLLRVKRHQSGKEREHLHDKAVELHLELIFFIDSLLGISLLIQSDSLKIEGEIVYEYLDTNSEYLFAIRKRHFRSHGLIGIEEVSEHQCQNLGTVPLGL